MSISETDTSIPQSSPKVEFQPFDKFWDTYPRKVAKGAARKAWEKATKGMSAEEEDNFSSTLLNSVRAQIKWRQDNAKNPNIHVPDWKHPSTWINGMCWLDELDSIGGKPVRVFDLETCNVAGCSELVPGPRFKQCDYHYSMMAGSRRGNIVSGDDLRSYMANSPVRRRKGESIDEWRKRMVSFCTSRASKIGG